MPLEIGGTGKETGWLSKWAFQVGALAADTIGRQAVAAGYITSTMFDDSIVARVAEHFRGVRAALATYIRAGEDLSAGVPITFTLTAQPDVPRTITWAFVAHAQITAYSITIVGVDAKGNAQTVTWTQAAGWSGETSIAFATITSIIMTARTGTGAADTMNIGIGSKLGLANDIAAVGAVYKVSKTPLATGIAVDYSGAANVTAEATYDTVDVSTGAAIVDGDDFNIRYLSKANAIP